MAWKTLDDMDVAAKTVLVRVDVNVPMENGRVTDATRIEKIVPTVQELTAKGAKVVLLAHFGRPKGKPVPEMSLRLILPTLEAALGHSVTFIERPSRSDIDALPPQHRATAQALLAKRGGAEQAAHLQDIADPLARLVAAGVLLRAELAHPSSLEIASETASAQGWRRPLLAWLQAQERVAAQAGAQDAAARLRRRIELVLSTPALVKP